MMDCESPEVIKKVLVEKINKSDWWHVPPRDPNAYKKRGKFLASTFGQAEFYGRPNDLPEKVQISNPLFGFSEKTIIKQLFLKEQLAEILRKTKKVTCNWYKVRIALDAEIAKQAKSLGYDSIALMTKNGERALKNNRKPNSIELNLLL